MIEYLIGKMLNTATITWFEEYPNICLKIQNDVQEEQFKIVYPPLKV